MRFLTDENISPLIADALDAAGHEVLRATTAMLGASVEEVIARAIVEERILITEDKDFGELVFKHGHKVPGVVRLALPGHTPAQKAARLLSTLAQAADKIAGLATVVERQRVRSRALPKNR